MSELFWRNTGGGVHREGGTGEGGFNPKCGAEAVRKCGVIVSSDLGKTWDTSRLHESLGFDRKNGQFYWRI